jgi:hypothetical protein
MDANFRLKLKSRGIQDPELGSGLAYFVNTTKFGAHLNSRVDEDDVRTFNVFCRRMRAHKQVDRDLRHGVPCCKYGEFKAFKGLQCDWCGRRGLSPRSCSQKWSCRPAKGREVGLCTLFVCPCTQTSRQVRQYGLYFLIHFERRESQKHQDLLRYCVPLVYKSISEDARIFRRAPDASRQVCAGILHSQVSPPRTWLELSYKIFIQLSSRGRSHSRRKYRVRMGPHQSGGYFNTRDGRWCTTLGT